MSGLWMLAAAKILLDRDTAEASRRKRQTMLQEDEKARRRAGYASGTVKTSRSYMDCIIKEMVNEMSNGTENKVTLIGFFEEFEKVFKEICLEDSSAEKEELKKIKERLEEANKKLENERKKLGNKISLVKELDLSIEVLEDPSKEKLRKERFRIEYESRNKDNREAELEKEINRLKRNLKFFPFIKKEDNLFSLELTEGELERIQKAKEKMEKFEYLSPEDKKEIIDYLKAEDEKEKIEGEYRNKEYEIKNLEQGSEGNGYASDRKKIKDRYLRTYGRMLSSGRVTEEDLEIIFKKLDKVGIKARRGEYQFGHWSSDKDGHAEHYRNSISWFVTDVYEENERFLERNTQSEIEADLDDNNDDGR